MPKKVLDVGQCDPDHAAIRSMLQREFSVTIVRTRLLNDTLDALRDHTIDLVLVNRQLDADYSDGLDIIKRIKTDPKLSLVPCMLVTNLAEHQEIAVAAGATRGFGKAELDDLATRARLAEYLQDALS